MGRRKQWRKEAAARARAGKHHIQHTEANSEPDTLERPPNSDGNDVLNTSMELSDTGVVHDTNQLCVQNPDSEALNIDSDTDESVVFPAEGEELIAGL